MPSTLAIVGAGGQASDVLSVVEALPRRWSEVVLLADPPPDLDRRFGGRAVVYGGSVGRLEELDADSTEYVVAVGYPEGRKRLALQLGHLPHRAATLVHPRAGSSFGVQVGEGSVILAGAELAAFVRIGRHAHVGQSATIGHDAVVGNYSSVMPSATLSGAVQVGDCVLIGAAATVLEGRRVADGATVGAGAVVIADVPEGATVVGVPARAR